VDRRNEAGSLLNKEELSRGSLLARLLVGSVDDDEREQRRRRRKEVLANVVVVREHTLLLLRLTVTTGVECLWLYLGGRWLHDVLSRSA